MSLENLKADTGAWTLSMMARITLIRSVLSSLPLHLLSNAVIPITCLRRIERCFRDFLWGSMQDGHGMHLLAWDTICMPISDGGLGIQSLVVRKEVMLARHASRFLLDPHCFWSSVMRARYGEWSPDMPSHSPRGYSFFWKEVCGRLPVIRNDISWMIGDGTVVNVVHDIWLSDLPLAHWPTFISTEVTCHMRVSDLISQDLCSWHIPTVFQFFGEELARRILSIPLTDGRVEDTRLWRRSCLSRAPTRDLLKIYRPLSQVTRDAAWIWKLPIHPRLQLFIWKLEWNCLPTCFLLSGRGLSIQAICPLCGQEDETIDHAIFECARARHIWSIVGYQIWEDGTSSARISFLRDIRRNKQQKGAIWAATAYQIWLSRNQLIFTDVSVPPQRTARIAISFSADYSRSAFDLDRSGHWGSPATSVANRQTVFISWEPPPPGYVKINFDGSVRGRLAGSAFIIRSLDGGMLAAGGFGLLDSSVPMAELYAAWAGISYAARTLHAQSLFIEGDSLTVIRWLRQECSGLSPSNPLLLDVWSLLREVSCFQIRHVYREANSAADWIAGAAVHLSGFWLWKQGDPCPIVLKQLLYSDISGLTHTRLV